MANANDIEKEFAKLSDEGRRKALVSWESFLAFAVPIAGLSPLTIPILLGVYKRLSSRQDEGATPRQASAGHFGSGNVQRSQTTSADDRSPKMLDIAEFKRRLAGGEFDDSVRRLLGEMDVLDETEDSDGALSPEMHDVLGRGRLLGRSTLRRLYVSDISGSTISSNGPHKLHLQLLTDQPAAPGLTLTIADDGTANLSGAFPAGWQPLDFVAVVPHVKRNSILRRLSIDSTIVTPRTEPPRASRRIPTTTVMSTPTPDEGASETKSLPSFEVTFDSVQTSLRISTPLQPRDGDELIVLVTIESESPVPAILERSEGSDQQLAGRFVLTHDLHGVGRIKVKVSSIDVEKLGDLPPEHVSLWLATQAMIAMPLKPTGDGYAFTMYDADREFINQHPEAVFAIRVVPQVSGVAR